MVPIMASAASSLRHCDGLIVPAVVLCHYVQVLTLENYQQTLYSIVRASNWAASLWFVAWTIIGGYALSGLGGQLVSCACPEPMPIAILAYTHIVLY